MFLTNVQLSLVCSLILSKLKIIAYRQQTNMDQNPTKQRKINKEKEKETEGKITQWERRNDDKEHNIVNHGMS